MKAQIKAWKYEEKQALNRARIRLRKKVGYAKYFELIALCQKNTP